MNCSFKRDCAHKREFNLITVRDKDRQVIVCFVNVMNRNTEELLTIIT